MSPTWVPVPDHSEFPLHSLPFGVIDPGDGARIVVAIGDHALDMRALAGAGLLDVEPGVAPALSSNDLNAYLSLGREAWGAVRGVITGLLMTGEAEIRDAGALLDPVEAVHLLPFVPGDFVDGYSSLEHATTMGRILRPEGEPLLPNWRHMPVAYRGTPSTVMVSGSPVRRPRGQVLGPDGMPEHRETAALDFELEVGFVVGPGNGIGRPIDIDDTADHIFGVVLVNDWSARDFQKWEGRPLGPNIAKSFATSVSPWVIPLDALTTAMIPSRPQSPQPLEYLRPSGDWGLDLDLGVDLGTAASAPMVVSRTSMRGVYWTFAQQLAHLTVNGAALRPGDLISSGTISGKAAGSKGCLIEATLDGARPITLPSGETRSYLEDGDTVVLRGSAPAAGIGLGEVVGTVLPAHD